MDETKRVRRTVSVLVAKTCDRCKRRAELSDVLCNPEVHEFVRIEWTCGYGSIIGDGDSYAVDLCEVCVKDLLLPHARLICETT